MKRLLFLVLIDAIQIFWISIVDLASTADFAFLEYNVDYTPGGLGTCDHGRLVDQKAAAAKGRKSPPAS